MEAGKKPDRRVHRTRLLLQEALLDLIMEKGYEAITIQDIIDRANIGRSTFYSHYADKEKLLLSNIEHLRAVIKDQSKDYLSPLNSGELRFGFSLPMLQHIQSHRHIYRAVAGKQSGVVVQFHMKRMLVDLIGEEIDLLLPDKDTKLITREVRLEFIVNTFWSLLTWWMDNKMPCSAQELNTIFHTLTFHGISAFD
ncbi:TetR/AcrR family transcriptional regulator [Paenibacillus lutrae]|nr:TetR/AcrR family transcriptional regulator [Paenibacillus lutrae]